jgi:hypothetical protein
MEAKTPKQILSIRPSLLWTARTKVKKSSNKY